MKAYLINMHLLVPRSRSSAKVKVKYKGYIFQKMAISGAFVFYKHILFFVQMLSHYIFYPVLMLTSPRFLKVPVNGNEKNFENLIIPPMNYLFSGFF